MENLRRKEEKDEDLKLLVIEITGSDFYRNSFSEFVTFFGVGMQVDFSLNYGLRWVAVCMHHWKNTKISLKIASSINSVLERSSVSTLKL